MGMIFEAVCNDSRTAFKTVSIRMDTIKSADERDGYLIIEMHDIAQKTTFKEEAKCAISPQKTMLLSKLANWLRGISSGS